MLAQVEPDLAEWDYGDYEGIRTPRSSRNGLGGISLLADARWGTPGPGFRAGDRLIQKLEALESNAALISHGHYSRVLAARWIGSPVLSGQRLMLDTGTLSILQDDPRHPENRVISLWNAGPAVPP